MTPKPNLHLIEGEVRDDCANCEYLEGQLKGAEREVRAWRTRYHKLSQETKHRHEGHPQRPTVERLFGKWQFACRHPRSKLGTGDGSRFAKLLWALETYDEETCDLVIEGAERDPWITQGKDGPERQDDILQIFKDERQVEKYANRGARARKAQAA